MNRAPLVSIGMSVLNCEKTIGLAITSILKQTYKNWELILIDDGSTDMTVQMANSFKDPRIKVVADGRRTTLANRLNQAIEISRGRYLARMDGDDVSYPERIERQVEYLEQHPEIDLLGCGILVFKGDGHPLGTRRIRESHAEICRRPWSGFYIPHVTWVGRIDWFRTNPYRRELTRTQDQDLLLRTYSSSRFACLPEVLLGFREETVSLNKTLVGRWSFCDALVRNASSTSNYLSVLRGITEQGLKALVDILAVTTGLNYRILRHRALPTDEGNLERWKKVWSHLQK